MVQSMKQNACSHRKREITKEHVIWGEIQIVNAIAFLNKKFYF